VVNANEILDSIRPQLRDHSQETRIRDLYERTHTAYETDGRQGIKRELEAGWVDLQKKFDAAIEAVKKDTGLF